MVSFDPAGADAPRGWIDGLLIATGCTLLYLLFGQETLYRIDAHALLWRSQVGAIAHPYHTFYLPLLELMKWLCSPWGLSLYEIARAFSALGTCGGLILTHAANRRIGLPRIEAALVTALMGLCPSVLFFATIVEVHGPFFCFVGLTYLLTANLLRAPSILNALLLGCGLGSSFLAHPLGALMGGLLPVTWMWQRARSAEHRELLPIRSLFVLGAIAAGMLLLWILLLPLIIRSLGFMTDAEFSFQYLVQEADRLIEPWRFLAIVWGEWFTAFLPMSLAGCAFLFWSRWRPTILVYGLALLPYLITCHLMLLAYGELGAYVIPMVWPLALLLAPVCRRLPWLAFGLLSLSLFLGMSRVGQHDQPGAAGELAAGMEFLSNGDEYFAILGSKEDLEAYFVYMPNLPQIWIPDLFSKKPGVFERALADLDETIDEYLDAERMVLVSRSARGSIQSLAETYPSDTAKRFLQHMEAEYRFEAVQALGFDGFSLHRR